VVTDSATSSVARVPGLAIDKCASLPSKKKLSDGCVSNCSIIPCVSKETVLLLIGLVVLQKYEA
jgi:hypothetical protein